MQNENSRFDRLVAKWNGAFWDDPKTSALNRNCKANELANLYVVDASLFCSRGAVNPAV
jgi:choline dehydrogenase-like flavoprotein